MKVRSFNRAAALHTRFARAPLPGTGILLAGAVSILIWAMIAGIAGLL